MQLLLQVSHAPHHPLDLLHQHLEGETQYDPTGQGRELTLASGTLKQS